MKKVHASLFSMLLGGLAVTACYDDLGNYSYRDINELHVEGIERDYVRDVDDSLKIVPVLQARNTAILLDSRMRGKSKAVFLPKLKI